MMVHQLLDFSKNPTNVLREYGQLPLTISPNSAAKLHILIGHISCVRQRARRDHHSLDVKWHEEVCAFSINAYACVHIQQRGKRWRPRGAAARAMGGIRHDLSWFVESVY